MTDLDLRTPDLLPVLSRGKHRNPRSGACFMELASFLAGERWSDHPSCTHPLLAALARSVNDHTSDAGRSRLAPLVPSVIGLRSDDLHVDVRIALRASRAALPVVAEERQRVMAVSLLSAERMLDGLDGRPVGTLEPASVEALDSAPLAAQWARRFSRLTSTRPKGFRKHAAPATVAYAVDGIARAAVPDTDAALADLLEATVAECVELVGAGRPRVDTEQWQAACALTVR